MYILYIHKYTHLYMPIHITVKSSLSHPQRHVFSIFRYQFPHTPLLAYEFPGWGGSRPELGHEAAFVLADEAKGGTVDLTEFTNLYIFIKRGEIKVREYFSTKRC